MKGHDGNHTRRPPKSFTPLRLFLFLFIVHVSFSKFLHTFAFSLYKLQPHQFDENLKKLRWLPFKFEHLLSLFPIWNPFFVCFVFGDVVLVLEIRASSIGKAITRLARAVSQALPSLVWTSESHRNGRSLTQEIESAPGSIRVNLLLRSWICVLF